MRAHPHKHKSVHWSARAQVEEELKIPVVSVVGLTQLIAFLETRQPEQAQRLREHKQKDASRD